MIDKKTIEVILKLKDQFSGALKSISTKAVKGLKGVENQSKKTNTGFTDMAKSAKTFIKILVGLQILKSVAGWLNNASAAAEKYNISLNALNNLTQQVGISSKDLISDLSKASQAQVGMRDLVAISNRMIALLGREAVPRFRELAEVALKASQVMGTSVTTALNDLTIGIGRQSRLILDNLGLIVSAETANLNYAKSLGISKDQLTFTQQKQAFMNEALKQAKEKYSAVNVVLSGRDGMTAAVDNFTIALGGALNKSGAINEILVFMADEFNKTADSMNKDGDSISDTIKSVSIGMTHVAETILQMVKVFQLAFSQLQLGWLKFQRTIISGADSIGDKIENTFGKSIRIAIGTALGATGDPRQMGFAKALLGADDIVNDFDADIKKLTVDIDKLWEGVGTTSFNFDELRDSIRAASDDSDNFSTIMGGLGNDLINNVIPAIDDTTNAVDDLSKALDPSNFKITFEDVLKIPLAPFRLKDFGQAVDPLAKFRITDKNLPPLAQFRLKDFGLPSTPRGFPLTGVKGLGANVNILSLLGTGLGAAGGGGIGIVQALLPAIGNIIAPGIGGLIGGGLSAIVGLFKKKRRGETPAEPVFTSDVNLQNAMTELLNAVKSQLTVRAAGGTQRVSVMLREQALAAGFS